MQSVRHLYATYRIQPNLASRAVTLRLMIKNYLIIFQVSLQCQDYHQHHGTSSTLLHSLSPTLKSRRNAAAPLVTLGSFATAQPSVPATFAHTLANFSRFVETLPVIERRGRRRIIAVSNGVFVNAIDRGEKRNDKSGVELDFSLDLGSRDRLGGCIGSLTNVPHGCNTHIQPTLLGHFFPALDHALLSLLSLLGPAALSMDSAFRGTVEWAPGTWPMLNNTIEIHPA
ncbi:hypothetical protein BU17DRAFT_83793 [Hysterangium stoloniferum]|nr:hypothetical protein BU17DRAFT_83793 [Hysterangium stoloniferum]